MAHNHAPQNEDSLFFTFYLIGEVFPLFYNYRKTLRNYMRKVGDIGENENFES